MSFQNNKLKKLIIAAMFGAIICVVTMVVKIPLPLGGYVHLGDAFIILAGLYLGWVYGGAAVGIGSMLADVFTGYVNYAIPTFLIKFLMAASVWGIFKLMGKKNPLAAKIIGGIFAELIMTFGYFACDWIFYGSGAIVNLFMYLIKGGVNIAVALAFLPIFVKIERIDKLNKS